MKTQVTFSDDRPFDDRIVEDLDMESINSGLEHGNMYLQYQFATLSYIQDNCRMLLGWLIAAMMALTGALIATAASDTPDTLVLITTGYELLFAFTITFTLIRGVMFKRTVHLPGDSPSHFFQDEIMKPLEGFQNKGKYIKGWHLHEIQVRIMLNDEEQEHEVKIYRLALALILIAILSGALLLIALLLLGL